MNIRKIREDLGRAKASCMRRDFERALGLTIAALKELGGQTAPTDVRGDFRTTVAALATDPAFKTQAGPAAASPAAGGGAVVLAHVGQAVAYQPGKEAELLEMLSRMHRGIKGQELQEEYEAALQRKLNMDYCLRDGKKKLAEGNPLEADACFVEALGFYRDETSIFSMIAKTLMEAGEYVRALGHVRAGLKELPQDPELTRLAEECARLRQQT